MIATLALASAFVLPPCLHAPGANSCRRANLCRISMSAETGTTSFTEDELAALQTASLKPTGKLFGGGQVKGDASYRKLKAASTGGPLAADAWNEVRADHPILAAKTDEELASAFLQIEQADIAARAAKKAEAAPTSSDALSGVAPLVAAVVVGVAASTFLSGFESECVNAAACAEKEARASGQRQATPLEKYSKSFVESGEGFAASQAAAPRILLPDVSAGVANLGDGDWWKGVKK